LANGSANRFLWPLVRRSKLLPEGGKLDVHTLSQLADLTGQIRAAVVFAHSLTQPVEFDQEARLLWCHRYPHLSRDIPGPTGEILARGPAQVRRLATVYALLDRSTTVRHEHLNAALELWRYNEDSVRHIFGNSTGDPNADKLGREIKKAGASGLSRTQISADVFSGNKSAAEIDTLLELLRSCGQAHRKQHPQPLGPGHPPEIWVSGPAPAEPTKETN
jgi:hypothetical protein